MLGQTTSTGSCTVRVQWFFKGEVVFLGERHPMICLLSMALQHDDQIIDLFIKPIFQENPVSHF